MIAATFRALNGTAKFSLPLTRLTKERFVNV
jgi:hypothetical protein